MLSCQREGGGGGRESILPFKPEQLTRRLNQKLEYFLKCENVFENTSKSNPSKCVEEKRVTVVVVKSTKKSNTTVMILVCKKCQNYTKINHGGGDSNP